MIKFANSINQGGINFFHALLLKLVLLWRTKTFESHHESA